MNLIRTEKSKDFHFDIFREDSFGKFGFLIGKGATAPFCFSNEGPTYLIVDIFALFARSNGKEQLEFLMGFESAEEYCKQFGIDYEEIIFNTLASKDFLEMIEDLSKGYKIKLETFSQSGYRLMRVS